MTRLLAHCLYALVLLVPVLPAALAQSDERLPSPIPFWAPQQPPRARYGIDCAIRLADRVSLQGHVTVHFVNTTHQPLQTLAIDWVKVG